MTLLLRSLAGISLALASSLAQTQTDFHDLPNLGDAAGQVYSPQQDQALGMAFMRQLRQAGLILDDPEATSYLRAIGHRLALHSENPGHDFSFFLIRDNSINAFAGPAGHIGANAGLIIAAESESELAGVMAHEIAHVTQRHLARAFETADKLSLPTTAAIIAAILIGTQDGSAGAAALTAASAASMQHQINFTRANEKEADRVGIQTLATAGFDPNGMSHFFERLQKSAKLYGARPPEFLSTHPVTTNRIAEAESRARTYPPVTASDELQFQLLRAKLRVGSYENPSQVLSDFQRYHGKSGGDTVVERYEFGLLLLNNKRYADAATVLERLHRNDPDRIAYRIALADIHYQARQYQDALEIYQSTQALYPGEPAVILPYATTLLAMSKAEKAYALLMDFKDANMQEPQVFKLLAQAADSTDHRAQMHMAMSQFYYLNGFTGKAIEQMQLAEKTADLSDYQAAKIQAHLTRLKELRKAEELE
jgi:predicted Zn-dependent protease